LTHIVWSEEMHSVESIAAEIVRREGGYVNDPDDPGGATNHGVTLGTMKKLGVDLTRDGRVDTRDVKALSATQAADIFVRHYFREPRLDLLPAPLQPSVFDMQVNAGSNAVRILQRLMAAFGLPLKDDGVVGPVTARTVTRAMEIAPDHLVDAYGIARRNYYYRLGDRRAASRKYARARDGGKGGWIVRAEEFITARFHLSRAEHDARVAAWA
jgi:lysozyme family protein